MGGQTIHSPSTIPRNLVLPSWRKSRKRRVFNPKICDAAAHVDEVPFGPNGSPAQSLLARSLWAMGLFYADGYVPAVGGQRRITARRSEFQSQHEVDCPARRRTLQIIRQRGGDRRCGCRRADVGGWIPGIRMIQNVAEVAVELQNPTVGEAEIFEDSQIALPHVRPNQGVVP